ncbi:MAG TPA: hypothetical protein VNQ73_01580 [Ilumatobacter sp.]|nr:hypothetical protein [Ilumatobacter sp.]
MSAEQPHERFAHEPTAEELADDAESLDRPVPRWGLVAVAAFVALVVCGYVATGLAPRWATSNPEGLLALNSRIRHLLLAIGGGIGWWSYFVIAGLRLALAFVVCHLIGRAYSERVLVWFGKYLGYKREQMTALIEGFDRIDWVIVPWFAGSNIVAAISGIRRMHPVRLAVLLTIGIVARLVLYWWLGQAFDDELDSILGWVTRWQLPLTIVSIAAVLATIALNVKRGRKFT